LTIAIVVPTFNRGQLLQLTIAAVQQQTVLDWELVVVDDDSTDDTLAVVTRMAQLDSRIRVTSQPHSGIAAARNRGLERIGASEFVSFLDDDDLWEPHTLQRLSEAIKRNPAAIGAYGLAQRIDHRGRQVTGDGLAERQLQRRAIEGRRLVTLPTDAPTTFEAMAFGNVIMTPGTVLIRRSALDRAGHFREPAADWDMWLRLTMQGDLVFVPEIVIGYRSHPSNESHNILRNSKRKFMVHWRLLWSRDLTLGQRRTAWLGFLYYYLDLSRLGRTLRRVLRLAYKRTGAA
jgi:glycosyltransferase involved in cell wall biosynthesis